MDIKSIGPFYTSKLPSVAPYTAPSFNEEKSLKQSISKCKTSIQEL